MWYHCIEDVYGTPCTSVSTSISGKCWCATKVKPIGFWELGNIEAGANCDENCV